MTWDSVAVDHIGHRLILLDLRTVECHDCGKRKLVIPREHRVVSVTSPAPYRAPDRRDLPSPELIAYRKAQALAAVELARQKRTTAEDPQ